MRSEIMTVTPEMAQRWLDNCNIGNRTLRSGWVNYLTDEIKSGNWQVTHQGIAIDNCGRLLDGQHRLSAIVNSGISINILVSISVPTDAFKAMDNGVKRNMSDLTKLPRQIVDPLNLIVLLINVDKKVHPEQVLKMVRETDVFNILQELIDYCGTSRVFYSAACVKAAAYLAIKRGQRKDYVFDIYANLIHQRFDKLPSIAHCLIRQVNAKKVATSGERITTIAKCAKVFDIRNANITRLYISEDEINNVTKDFKAIFLKKEIL